MMRANDHLALCSDEGLGQQIERLTVNRSRDVSITIATAQAPFLLILFNANNAF